MPSDRKESPSSQDSVESGRSSKVGSDPSSGEATPVKQPGEGQGTRKTPRIEAPDSASSNDERKALPPVKKAFKEPDSRGSSITGTSRHTRLEAGMTSRLSVYSVNSGGTIKSMDTFGSANTLNQVRPDIDIIFVTPLEKHHECPVCGQVLRYPVQFDCKHHCCSGCLPELLRVEPRCPIDQSKIERDKVIVDKGLQRVIETLPVLCSNHEKGCVWSEKFKDLVPHLAQCPYSTIQCPNNCDAEFQRRFTDQHVSQDCPRRPISCLHCGSPILADEEKDHMEECLRLPVPCPNGCKHKEMPREEIQTHLDTKCARQPVECSFKGLGCDYECVRKDLADHNKANAEQHMNLVAESLALHKQNFDGTQRMLQQQTERLSSAEIRLENLEKLYGAQLVWRIDMYAEKMEAAVKGRKTTIYSPPFYTSRHGYKMIASTCLNGDGKSRGKHMSLFICICRGEFDNLLDWPFSHRVSFTLIDQGLDPAARRNITYSVKPNICKENKAFLGKPTTDRNASFGSQRFIELDMLKARDYVRDDIMFIKVVIDNEEADNV